VPALEKIWGEALGASLADFNFRSVTMAFNELVYEYPIRIPERYSLVIRSLLTQEGICMTLDKEFHFLEVAYPYVARRLLTDEDPALRQRLFQVLFQGGRFRWDRLENLVGLARETGGAAAAGRAAGASGASAAAASVDLTSTVADGARAALLDPALRRALLLALTEDDRLHVDEVARLAASLRGDVDVGRVVAEGVRGLPARARALATTWSDRVLAS
jgi:hypothetical protein